MSGNSSDTQLQLGQIMGQLQAVQQQIKSGFDNQDQKLSALERSINRRIDDHQRHVDGRISKIEGRVSSLERAGNSSNKKSAATGGGTAALVVALIEAAKSFFPGG